MLTFDNNEAGYLRWVHTNPSGFVINAEKRPGRMPNPYMLHRASCIFITTPNITNYTTTGYVKICSLDRQELVDWGTRHSRRDFLMCKYCAP